MSRIDDSLVAYLSNLPVAVAERYAASGRKVRCWYLYPPPEVSWLGDWQTRPLGAKPSLFDGLRQELEEVEQNICPKLSSSQNAFQAVVEILARRKVASPTRRAHPTNSSQLARPDAFYMLMKELSYEASVVNEQLEPL